MTSKPLTLVARLAVSITLSLIPITAQQSAVPPSAGKQESSLQPSQRGNRDPQADATNNAPAPAAHPATITQIFETPNDAIPPSTNEQSKLQQFFEKAATDPVVWVTAIITFFAGCQVVIYRQIRDHTKVVERPYVRMAHAQPGIVFVPDNGPPTAIRASITIRNTGHTPADILEMRWVRALNHDELIAERDRVPPARTAPIVMSLMPGASFNYWQQIDDISPSVLAQIQAGTHPLWLVGSVTYLDRFDKRRHWQGYGRRFIHQMLPGGNNNLVFMVEEPDFRHFHREEDLDKG